MSCLFISFITTSSLLFLCSSLVPATVLVCLLIFILSSFSFSLLSFILPAFPLSFPLFLPASLLLSQPRRVLRQSCSMLLEASILYLLIPRHQQTIHNHRRRCNNIIRRSNRLMKRFIHLLIHLHYHPFLRQYPPPYQPVPQVKTLRLAGLHDGGILIFFQYCSNAILSFYSRDSLLRRIGKFSA